MNGLLAKANQNELLLKHGRRSVSGHTREPFGSGQAAIGIPLGRKAQISFLFIQLSFDIRQSAVPTHIIFRKAWIRTYFKDNP